MSVARIATRLPFSFPSAISSSLVRFGSRTSDGGSQTSVRFRRIRREEAGPVSSPVSSPQASDERRDALVERLFQATIGALELYSIHLGWRLGLYETLAADGALTPSELARRAGVHERYAREWCEQQAVAGFLEVEDTTAPEDARRFRLPEAHVEVFTAPDHPAHVAPFAPLVVGVGGALPD